MAKKARKAAIRAAGAHWREATKAAADVGSLQIECLNQMRASGEKILEACGRTQLSFNLEVCEFVRREILPHLPPGMEINGVKACVHIASRFKDDIKTVEDLRGAKSELQLAFTALGIIEPRRHEGQSMIDRNLFCTVTMASRKLVISFEDLQKEMPMEEWSGEALDEILESLHPIRELITRIEKVRLGLKLPTP